MIRMIDDLIEAYWFGVADTIASFNHLIHDYSRSTPRPKFTLAREARPLGVFSLNLPAGPENLPAFSVTTSRSRGAVSGLIFMVIPYSRDLVTDPMLSNVSGAPQ